MEARSELILRIGIEGRTRSQMDAIVAAVRERLEALPGEPRPTLEVVRGERGAVAVPPEEPPEP